MPPSTSAEPLNPCVECGAVPLVRKSGRLHEIWCANGRCGLTVRGKAAGLSLIGAAKMWNEANPVPASLDYPVLFVVLPPAGSSLPFRPTFVGETELVAWGGAYRHEIPPVGPEEWVTAKKAEGWTVAEYRRIR